ncbi:MAG: hypothetical protein L0215_19175 [Gemmataceae bacterium]|nr:hypothetical protein [Gemmataceae bacterium]
MKNRTLLIAALGVCLGCSGGAKDDTKDPAKYALSIKGQVQEFLDESSREPARTSQLAAVLLETLEVYPTQAVGDHGATYSQLTERCRELVQAGKAGGADVRNKLNEMAALIKKLPG